MQLEGGGGGFIYSVNYERLIIHGAKFNTAIQAGVSFWGHQSNDFTSVYRVDLTETIGSRHLRFELGLGVSNFYESSAISDNSTWSTLLVSRVGVRYQKPEGRFLFRAAFTPLWGVFDDIIKLQSWGGISFGYAF